MKILIVLAALVAAGCATSPAGPAPVYHATLTTTAPIVGSCADVRCTYTAVVTNAGPDCATTVAMTVLVSEPPLGLVLAVGNGAAGILRPTQSVQVSGVDWPRNGTPIAAARATGIPIACP